MQRLRSILRRIDGRGFKAYEELRKQRFEFPGFQLYVDHVQGDPFATPSRFRLRVPQQVAAFPEESFAGRSREVALRDFLVRAFAREARRVSERRGSGKSGRIVVPPPGQEILERSACQVNQDFVEFRFLVGLPAAGRRVLSREADEMLTEALPHIVETALLSSTADQKALWKHVMTCGDTDALRASLLSSGLVAFVADDSVLPRRSGVDDRPLASAVPFSSPDSLRVEMKLPNRGKVIGMGLQHGITLVVGGGFHGKSTLLRALERGVYCHVPGDGRELVVAEGTAVKVRAEDGRSVVGVDISPFVNELPGGIATQSFTTENASGSTSQGANIAEALEAGSHLLLVDEDTSATNFMIRDRRMQALIEKHHEPITPFVDQVRRLYQDHGVSTILVMGGSGDYFEVADTVIAMVDYVPQDVTKAARSIAEDHPTGRSPEGEAHFGPLPHRFPLPASVDPRKGPKEVHVKTRDIDTLLFGRDEIDLSYVEQLVEPGQVKALGAAMTYAKRHYIDGKTSLGEILQQTELVVQEKGLDAISTTPFPPDFVGFRTQEMAAALNRLRSLQVKASSQGRSDNIP
jgi:predicted ABC-class ATPase